jgi:tetratricopeptide (TPR) repeat protein
MSKRPRSPSARPAAHASALEQADRALRSGRPDEAERLAAQVLKADRANLAAARALGAALILQNRPGEAVAPLQRAARRSGDPAIETLLARALAQTGRRDEALDVLREAQSRRPPWPQAFLELGDQLGAAGRFDEAAAAYEAGLALRPDALVLRVGLGYLCLQRNDRARALNLFQAVSAAAPERFDGLLGMARTLTLEGDYDRAAAYYRRVLELRPDDAASRIELGKCLLELGRREAGEATLRAAAARAPQQAGAAIVALAAAGRGRFFLRPSAAARFMRTETA